MPTYEHQNTSTAADLLSYEKYIDANSNTEELTRVDTSNQEWVIKETGGETFFIKFDNNFPKKHFFTDSKKQNAPANSADLKIAKSLSYRAVVDTCTCTHKYDSHNGGGKGGRCKHCGKTQKPCANFETKYSAMRKQRAKPSPNPYAGQRTKKNTCIVLSRISKADFENAVLKSILAVEKPATTWKQGDQLVKNVGDEVELTWDFSPHSDVIVQADLNTSAAQWAKKQACKVKAQKTATVGQKHTWQIFHMNGVIPP